MSNFKETNTRKEGITSKPDVKSESSEKKELKKHLNEHLEKSIYYGNSKDGKYKISRQLPENYKSLYDKHGDFRKLRTDKEFNKIFYSGKPKVYEYGPAKSMAISSRDISNVLEKRYPGRVSSSTIPRSGARMVHMAGKHHPRSGIVYNLKGFPIFDDVAVFDTRISNSITDSLDLDKKKKEKHFECATKKLDKYIKDLKDMGEKGKSQYNAIRSRFTPEQLNAIEKGQSKIPGFTWHHHENFSRMQLIPTKKYHVKTGHVGGMYMRKQ